jgi:hypothetical protein
MQLGKRGDWGAMGGVVGLPIMGVFGLRAVCVVFAEPGGESVHGALQVLRAKYMHSRI